MLDSSTNKTYREIKKTQSIGLTDNVYKDHWIIKVWMARLTDIPGSICETINQNVKRVQGLVIDQERLIFFCSHTMDRTSTEKFQPITIVDLLIVGVEQQTFLSSRLCLSSRGPTQP